MPNNKVNAKNKDTKINNSKKDNKKKVVKSD